MKIYLDNKDFEDIKSILDSIGFDNDMKAEIEKICLIKNEGASEDTSIYIPNVLTNALFSTCSKWIKIFAPQIKSIMKGVVEFSGELDQKMETASTEAEKKIEEEKNK